MAARPKATIFTSAMKEILDLSFSPGNIVPTILLIFVGLYWVVFLIGLLDLSFLDFDLDKDFSVDIDADVDVDIDVDADADAEGMGKGSGGKGLSAGAAILQFLNLDAVPFMVFLSFFSLFYWAGSVMGNHYLGNGETGLAIAIAAGAIILAALLTKAITQPFKGFFRSLNDAEKPADLRGRLCTLELGTSGKRLGQANVDINGKHLLVNVRSDTGERIEKGTSCVILEEGPGKEYYIVQPFEHD